MKSEAQLQNQLKAVRTRLGISQYDLARAAGVARQTVGGIEAGTYALSLTVALRLAKALGCTVEELFWLEDATPPIEARVILPNGRATPMGAGDFNLGENTVRVGLAHVGAQWIATPLFGEQGFRQEMLPADGVGTWNAHTGTMRVQLLDTEERLAQTVLVAGCAPALSLWARSAERWQPGLRVSTHHANSMAALAHLANGDVHLAGVHLTDPNGGPDNVAFVQNAMRGTPAALVNLGVWEEGFVVAPTNPKRITTGANLARNDVRLLNRDEGAGARLLLDRLLNASGVRPHDVNGYETIAYGHLEIARAVQTGRADVGVSTASVAHAFGLGFVPIQSVRYDLAVRQEFLALPAIQNLIGTLQHRRVRSQLSTLSGYDTTQSGEVTMVV